MNLHEVNVTGTHARLIVALSDLSAESGRLVVSAARIAECTGARLRVVHPLGVIGESLRNALFGAPPLQQRIETAAKRLSEQAATALAGADVPYEVVLDQNRGERVIVAQAASGVADLVIAPGNHVACALPIASLTGLRTPLLFIPLCMRVGSPYIIQALTQDVTPDEFIRARRWMRILQPIVGGPPASDHDGGELDILLYPDIDENAADAIDGAVAALRNTLTTSEPALVVALLPAAGAEGTHACAEALLRTLIAEAPCPVLAVPALPSLRAVWTPPAFVLSN